jgi:hypothetical protein
MNEKMHMNFSHGFCQFSNLDDFLYGNFSDVVFVEPDDAQGSRVTLCHLKYPNGWAAQDAIGRPFSFFHSDVKKGGENVVPDNDKFMNSLFYEKGWFERIGAFSIKIDDRLLDRHPDLTKPSGIIRPHVRFERQLITGLGGYGFVFIIQTHIVDLLSRPKLFKEAILCTREDSYCYETIQKHGDFLMDYIKGKFS